MSYIGSKPADAVLETDDITDGVITTSKLADNSVTTAKTSYQDAPFRNLIINGDMSIAQRGTSTSGVTGGGYYTVDRFRWTVSASDTVTLSQSTDTPSGQGFSNSFKVDVTTADTSISADQYAFVEQSVEAQNCQYLNYGTSSAKTLTLSFWVKSSKTGTYCIDIDKPDNTRYNYVAEYTIDSANTWEKKTIIIAPDSNIQAVGGAIDNNNGEGFAVKFTLATGSNRQGTNETWNTSVVDGTSNQVNFLDSTSNEWYITGIQLEAGTTASDFEFLPVDVNLNRCLRYYETIVTGAQQSFGQGVYYNGIQVYYSDKYRVTKRAVPTLDQVTGSNIYIIYRNNAGDNFAGFDNLGSNTTMTFFELNVGTSISGTGGQVGFFRTGPSSTTCFIAFDAEL